MLEEVHHSKRTFAWWGDWGKAKYRTEQSGAEAMIDHGGVGTMHPAHEFVDILILEHQPFETEVVGGDRGLIGASVEIEETHDVGVRGEFAFASAPLETKPSLARGPKVELTLQRQSGGGESEQVVQLRGHLFRSTKYRVAKSHLAVPVEFSLEFAELVQSLLQRRVRRKE